MTAHQTKKLDIAGLLEFRDRFSIPISDADVEQLNFYCPDSNTEEMRYLLKQRQTLGGDLPKRRRKSKPIVIPDISTFGKFTMEANDKGGSTTMAFVRMLGNIMKDKEIGHRIVPIVADEARTFGMASLFRQFGIYAPEGQMYEPEDSSSLLTYKEQADGQLLEEGISEAGAMASWTAAATSYSTHNEPMLPVYIYYSMFGFQRIGDLIWAAGDQRARGFLIGATAGKTTLSGEGLQHQDGSSQLIASTVPNCRAYDPCYAYELAVIFEHGAKRMLEQQEDEFYYITVMNENYPQPPMQPGLEENIIRGMYLLKSVGEDSAKQQVQLLGSGTILREVEAAGELLSRDFDIRSHIWSVTSFTELAREGQETDRQNRHNPDFRQSCYVEECLQAENGPVIAATDYVRQYAEQIRGLVQAPYRVLGTDGYGRSDARNKLRHFFEVDRYFIAITALQSLYEIGSIDKSILSDAIVKYDIDREKKNPSTV